MKAEQSSQSEVIENVAANILREFENRHD